MYRHICDHQLPVNVNVAYNDWPGVFRIVNNSMVKMTPSPIIPKYNDLNFALNHLSFDWEILEKFFQHYNMRTIWINCYGMIGVYNQTAKQWNGAVGKVS